jgi:hypothetical protein
MPQLTEPTLLRIRAMFPESQQQSVATRLEAQFGDEKFLRSDATPQNSERVLFAILRFSRGTMSGLEAAITLAHLDWRDLLMASGFGDPTAHTRWFPESTA